jgi:hypothetical protein
MREGIAQSCAVLLGLLHGTWACYRVGVDATMTMAYERGWIWAGRARAVILCMACLRKQQPCK